MLKKHTFWLNMAGVFMLITAGFHCISFIQPLQGENETEKHMFDLMNNYHADFGLGFHPTMMNLFNALSACFPLLLVFGALVNDYLLRKKVSDDILKGIVNINLIVFGICFVLMAKLTFIIPAASMTVVFTTLVVARVCFPKV